MVLDVTIVGNGRVGSTLAPFARRVVAHNEWNAWLRGFNAYGELPTYEIDAGNEQAAAAAHITGQTSSLVVLAVHQAELAGMVRQMVDTWQNHKGPDVVVHTSGLYGANELHGLTTVNCAIGAAHPFQTFGISQKTNLTGVGWGVECEDAAWPAISQWVGSTKGVVHRFLNCTASQRLAYHAAAVAGGNLSMAAVALARGLAQDAGVEAAQFVVPIVTQAMTNAFDAMSNNVPTMPITGPLARAEVSAVRAQLAAVPSQHRELYRLLSLALLEVLETSGTLDATTVHDLREVLQKSKG